MNAIACLLCLLVMCLFFAPSQQCKIELKIFSRTHNPFMLQVIVPSLKLKTEKIEFTRKDENQRLVVEGKNCNEKQWIMKTWKLMDNEWIPAREIKAKIDGFGWVVIAVEDDYRPSLRERTGIFCSEGVCS